MIAAKTCSLCGQEKPLTDFYKQALGRLGRAAKCKACHRIPSTKWADRLALLAQGLRRCEKCSVIKPISGFEPTTNARDGYYTACKACRGARIRERRKERGDDWVAYLRAYMSRRKDAIREYQRAWEKENRDKMRAYAKRSRAKRALDTTKTHAARVLQDEAYRLRCAARHHAHYEANKERARDYSREYYRRNPAWGKAVSHRRNARKKQNGGSFTADEWVALCVAHDHRCACCGTADVPLTADHVIPVSKGGTSYIDNIQPLCQPCNSRKFVKTTDYRRH